MSASLSPPTLWSLRLGCPIQVQAPNPSTEGLMEPPCSVRSEAVPCIEPGQEHGVLAPDSRSRAFFRMLLPFLVPRGTDSNSERQRTATIVTPPRHPSSQRLYHHCMQTVKTGPQNPHAGGTQ